MVSAKHVATAMCETVVFAPGISRPSEADVVHETEHHDFHEL